jgi:ubiquinone/menaquinone biosynthesis C-methylase UbiE
MLEPTTTAHPPATSAPAAAPDLAAIKAKQRATWGSADFALIGTTLQLVGETLCEAADVAAGERVLDVACGNGNAALAAARRFAVVTGVDYVPACLEHARARAAADGVELTVREGDAEALPFADGTFDVVLSTFGVMFAPDQPRAARELARVCRSGGRIALASWTPDGFVGHLLRAVGKHVPPPAGLTSPAAWGTARRLDELFAGEVRDVATAQRSYAFRYRSAAHFVEVFRTHYGPVHRAFAALPPDGQAALERDLVALLDGANTARDGSLCVPAAYLEAVLFRA